MPLVRIALRSGKSEIYRKAIGDAVHECMVRTLNVPRLDRFQIITEHESGGLIYLDTHRTEMVSGIECGGVATFLADSLKSRTSLFI